MTKTEPTNEQKIWGQFYRVLHDEAEKIRLIMLRARMAATLAAAEDEQPAQPDQRRG